MYIGAAERSGSVSHGQVGDGIGFGLEQLTETGAELAAEDSAADLGQEVGASLAFRSHTAPCAVTDTATTPARGGTSVGVLTIFPPPN